MDADASTRVHCMARWGIRLPIMLCGMFVMVHVAGHPRQDDNRIVSHLELGENKSVNRAGRWGRLCTSEDYDTQALVWCVDEWFDEYVGIFYFVLYTQWSDLNPIKHL